MTKHYCTEALMDDGRWARVSRPTPDHGKALRDMRRFLRRNPHGLARLVDPSTDVAIPAPRLSTAAMIVAGLLSMTGAPAAEAAVQCMYDAGGAYVCRDVYQPEYWSQSQTFGPNTTIIEHFPDGVHTHVCTNFAGIVTCN
jgi:hypothetical protein